MAPSPYTPTTPKKRKHSNLTFDAGNDTESDYNPRKPKHKPKLKTKSSKPAAKDQKVIRDSTSLSLQPSSPYADAIDGDGVGVGGEKVAEAPHLPTPPKASLFSKFNKRKKSNSQSTIPGSTRDKSYEFGSSQRLLAFASSQQLPSSAYTPSPSQSMIKSTGKPLKTTNLLATHQTRSATRTLPRSVVPNYAQPCLSSVDSFDLVANLLVQPSSPLNQFRKQSPTKSALRKGQEQSGGSTPDRPQKLPVKPSGIKLRFNLKGKKAAAKSTSFEDTSSRISSLDISSPQSSSSYKPPTFGSGNSSLILKTRFQSSPPKSLDGLANTPSNSQGGFVSRMSSSQYSHRSSGSSGSSGSGVYREPTLEDRVFHALQTDFGSDFEAEDIGFALLEDIVYKNVESSGFDSGSDCATGANILAKVKAEEGEMNNANDISSITPKWQSSPYPSHGLYLADVQELTNIAEKLYWLQMQAQWAERGGVRNSFLAGLGGEILHLEAMKLSLRQKLSYIHIFGGVVI